MVFVQRDHCRAWTASELPNTCLLCTLCEPTWPVSRTGQIILADIVNTSATQGNLLYYVTYTVYATCGGKNLLGTGLCSLSAFLLKALKVVMDSCLTPWKNTEKVQHCFESGHYLFWHHFLLQIHRAESAYLKCSTSFRKLKTSQTTERLSV